MVAENDRRVAQRYPLDWQVCVWHDRSKRFFNGKSANISGTGALIYLPLTAPISVDEELEVNFPSPTTPGDERYPARVFTARVVRVNRPESILDGRQAVAMQFV